jgi:hypothetical protein
MEVRLLQNLAMEMKGLDPSHFARCNILITLSHFRFSQRSVKESVSCGVTPCGLVHIYRLC